MFLRVMVRGCSSQTTTRLLVKSSPVTGIRSCAQIVQNMRSLSDQSQEQKYAWEANGNDTENGEVIVDEGDVFGTLASDADALIRKSEFAEDDNDAQDEHEAKVADIYRPGKEDFLRKINTLIHEKKDLRSALNVLETEMKEELVRPEQAHFRVLIHACAMVGHTKKAFQLYREFKERALPRHVGIYTDLFSACTRSHDRVLGLQKATSLLNELREAHFTPSRVLFNSMIQAFGRCGDMKTAFNLVDEMKDHKIPLTTELLNFLLQACLTDKESGFRHAITVVRNMRRKKIPFDIYTYHLVIRTANECGLGDKKFLQDIFLESLPLKKRRLIESSANLENTGVLQPGAALTEDNLAQCNWWEVDLNSHFQHQPSNSVETIPVAVESPSLLERSPYLDNVLRLDMEDNAESRLMLLGNPSKLLDVMVLEDKVNPEIKTMSLLIANKSCPVHEQNVLTLMETYSIKPDVPFVNQLIKQRAFRRDYAAGVELLALISAEGLTPDVQTFASLALCCQDRKSGLKLLSDLASFGAKPNSAIMGTLIKGAITRHSVTDVHMYLERIKNERVLVEAPILKMVEKFYQTYRNFIKTKESGGYVPYPVVLEMKQDYANWRKFTRYYKEWLNVIKFETATNELDQYKTISDVEKEKQELDALKQERIDRQMERRKRWQQNQQKYD